MIHQRLNIMEHTAELQKTILKYGCMCMAQTEYFMLPTETGKRIDDYSIKTVKALASRNTISYEGDIVMPARNRKYDEKMIDALWIMIDYYRSYFPDSCLFEAQKQSFSAEYPLELTFIDPQSIMVKVIVLQSSAQLTDLLFEQERFYKTYEKGNEDKARTLYIIALRNEELLPEIEAYNITIPHKICLMQGDITQYPDTTYYSAN